MAIVLFTDGSWARISDFAIVFSQILCTDSEAIYIFKWRV